MASDSRDANLGAGIQSGLIAKQSFAAADKGVGQLGKPIQSKVGGQAPWTAPPRDGAGRGHTIKNG